VAQSVRTIAGLPEGRVAASWVYWNVSRTFLGLRRNVYVTLLDVDTSSGPPIRTNVEVSGSMPQQFRCQ
jgi:hypothetical protein